MAKALIYNKLDCVTPDHILADAAQITTENGKTVEQRLNEIGYSLQFATDADIDAIFENL